MLEIQSFNFLTMNLFAPNCFSFVRRKLIATQRRFNARPLWDRKPNWLNTRRLVPEKTRFSTILRQKDLLTRKVLHNSTTNMLTRIWIPRFPLQNSIIYMTAVRNVYNLFVRSRAFIKLLPLVLLEWYASLVIDRFDHSGDFAFACIHKFCLEK